MIKKLTVCFIAVCLLLPVISGAAETQVSISLSENLVTIGDRIRLTIIVKTTADVDKITLKTATKEFEALEQQDTRKRRQQDYTVFEKVISIAFFKTGDFNVGPFEIDLKKNDEVLETRETNSVPVTVKTVLTEEDKDIKALKDPIEMKGDPFYILKYVITAILLVIVVILLVMWIRKRMRREPTAREPLLSPAAELEKRVKELVETGLFQKGKTKLFFLELTQVLKHFLHRCYQFNAEDFTTYETMARMKQLEDETLLLNGLEFSFSTADLVKFAKFVPEASVLEEVLTKITAMTAVYRERELRAADAAGLDTGAPGNEAQQQEAAQ